MNVIRRRILTAAFIASETLTDALQSLASRSAHLTYRIEVGLEGAGGPDLHSLASDRLNADLDEEQRQLAIPWSH